MSNFFAITTRYAGFWARLSGISHSLSTGRFFLLTGARGARTVMLGDVRTSIHITSGSRPESLRLFLRLRFCSASSATAGGRRIEYPLGEEVAPNSLTCDSDIGFLPSRHQRAVRSLLAVRSNAHHKGPTPMKPQHPADFRSAVNDAAYLLATIADALRGIATLAHTNNDPDVAATCALIAHAADDYSYALLTLTGQIRPASGTATTSAPQETAQ